VDSGIGEASPPDSGLGDSVDVGSETYRSGKIAVTKFYRFGKISPKIVHSEIYSKISPKIVHREIYRISGKISPKIVHSEIYRISGKISPKF
jgi:hypothetical protein